MTNLDAVSPIDGRYYEKTRFLRQFFSEFALIKARLEVEIKWLQFLASHSEIKELPVFSEEEALYLENLIASFDKEQALRVKEYERSTNHDVKAVEYYLAERCCDYPGGSLKRAVNFIHFGCTSEDINNLAYGLILSKTLNSTEFSVSSQLLVSIQSLARKYASVPMLSRTHGQPATPTTLGKELSVFSCRIDRQLYQVLKIPILGKMNGAVGNYNAHLIAYPDIQWEELSVRFVRSLGLRWSPRTTQIEPHDYMAELFHALIRLNTILIDFNRDIWGYISLGYLKQKTVSGEVGSSTMPHKVNPIDFENSEGNLGIANALLGHLASKLQVSRFQRDLSDSTALRNIGVAFSHSLLAYSSTLRGLAKVEADLERIETDLSDRWELLGEAVQTVMRRYGVKNPYQKLKQLTRGAGVTKSTLHAFIRDLSIPEEAKERLLALNPTTYLGNAAQQVPY